MPKAYAQSNGGSGGQGDVTRRRLLEAAASLVAERGWGAVKTRAVAERAGVNQALVHYHYANMDSLLREAVLWRLRPAIQALADELLDDRPFPEGIVRTMHLLDRFEPGSEDGVLMAEALLRASRDERMAAALGDVAGSWTAMLEPRIVTAQRRGVVRGDLDPAALARLLAAVLDGLLIQRMAGPGIDTAVVAGTITQLLAAREEDVA